MGWEGRRMPPMSDCPQKQHGRRQELLPLPRLSPPCVLQEPTGLKSPPGGPSLDGGPRPGRLHQPHRVSPGVVEGTAQQPADGREVGEVAVAQVCCPRARGLQRAEEKRPPAGPSGGAHRPWGWPRAGRCAPGPAAPRRSGQEPRRRGGRGGSGRQRPAPGWHWRSRGELAAPQELPSPAPRLGSSRARGCPPAALSWPCCSAHCTATRPRSRHPAASHSAAPAWLSARRDHPEPWAPGQLSMSQKALEEEDALCLPQPP